MAAPAIQVLGDSAFLCVFPPPATLARQQQVWAAAAALEGDPGVVDVVPGMNNLMLVFDPLQADADALFVRLTDIWSTLADAPAQAVARVVEIPVRYGGEDGPDLNAVAAHAGLHPDEVIARHSGADYCVYCLGFQPGFAYLGGLDPQLATPRRQRATPRRAIYCSSASRRT